MQVIRPTIARPTSNLTQLLANDNILTLDDIGQGAAVAATNDDDGADFFATSIDPEGGPGGYVACIIDLALDDSLPAEDDQEIAILEYTISLDAAAGEISDLTFTDGLGSPAVATVVVETSDSVAPT